MASPFSIFRKHQAAMIVVFMVMLMVAFVVLPQILKMMDSGLATDPVVLTSRYGSLHASDLHGLQKRRQLANGFMHSVYEAALGQPLPSNFRRFGEATEEQVVNAMLLAKKAEELGIVISDRQVNQFLERESDNKVSGVQQANLAERFQQSQTVVMDALRNELLAMHFSQLYLAGIGATPPSERWDYYQRVYRSADIEVVAVPVANYLDQIADPSEAELESFFDEHKTTYPVPGSPDPGFRQPSKARFQYFKADYDQFVENADVTDEEIAAEYEKNKEFYPFSGLTIEPEQPPLDVTDEGPSTDAGDSGDGATEYEKSDDDAAQPPGEEGADVVDDSAEETAEPTAPADSPAGGSETSDADGDEPPLVDDEGQPQASRSSLPVRRVAYQPPVADDDEDAPGDDSADAPPVNAENDTDTDNRAADPLDDTDTGDVSDPLTGDAFDTWPPADYTLPDDIRGGPDPQYDPLWKVRDKIRDTLAAERAGAAMQEAIDRVAEQMRAYSRRLTGWEIDQERGQGDGSPKPVFDAEASATADGVTAHITPLLSAREILDQTDLGQSTVNGVSFLRVAYRDFDVFRSERSRDISGHQYIFWKLDGADDFVPELDQVRHEVVRAWKTIAARDATMAAAGKLRDEAAAAHQPLTEVFAGRADIEVIQPPRFSWVSGGTTAFLSQQVQLRISEVEGVVDAGGEFMRTTFDLAAGEVGVAMNHPQAIAYVIRVDDIDSESLARELFMAVSFSRYQSLANADRAQMTRRWVKQIQDDAQLTWQRDADAELVR